MPPSHYRSFVKDNAVVAIAGHVPVYMKGTILMPIIIKTDGVTTYGGFIQVTSIIGTVLGILSFGVGFKKRRLLPSNDNAEACRELYYPSIFFQLASVLFLTAILLIPDKQIKIDVLNCGTNFLSLIIPY